MNVPKVVIVNYTIQDAFKIPASIDLADESVVKWGVTYNKLYIHFVDGTVKEIESVGWIDEFDYERPTGELEVDYAHNHGLEEEEEDEEEEEEEDDDTTVYCDECGIENPKYIDMCGKGVNMCAKCLGETDE